MKSYIEDLIPQVEVSAIGHLLVAGVSAKILPMRNMQCVFGQRLENGLAIPCSNDPSRDVLHKFCFFIPVDAQLLQELSIALRFQQWPDSKFSGSHLDLFAFIRFIVQIVQIGSPDEDSFKTKTFRLRNGRGKVKIFTSIAKDHLVAGEVYTSRDAFVGNLLITAWWR